MKLSYAKATQNETLPTWGLGGINARFIGAPSKLDGRIDTTTMELGLNSRPIKNLSIVASLRYNDVDDKTPLAGFVGNNTTGAITVHNTPHSIKTHSGKLEGTYRLPDGISLVAGFDVKRQDRSVPLFESERFVPFRTKLDEDTYRIQLRKSMSETVNGTVAYLHSKRDGSSYLATEHFPSDLINPLHIADRQRDKWRASVDWTPINNLSLQGTVEDSRDDYGTSASRPYGLTDGNASMYSIDATYVIKDTWSVSTWFAHDKTAAKQLGARWDRVTERYEIDKEHRLRDQGDSFGVGVRGNVSSKFKMGAEYQRTRNTSDYRNSEITNGIGAGLTPAVGAPPTTARNGEALPDIENKLDRFTLFAEYSLNKQGDIRVDLIHERWRTDDWTWMMLPATGLTAFVYAAPDGTSVMAKQRQSATFIGARYIYKFQ
jgi:MtrB/PioB family decaheme-associated outer membrane protein